MDAPGIVGREDELAAVVAFVDDASAGSALVLAGEAGIGKTTVWRAGVEQAEERGVRVLQAAPAESEAALSFVALADLLEDHLGEVLPRLPAVQRRALEAALLAGEGAGGTADRRVVAAAVLGALRVLADDRPLLVAVDDVQWLDRASAAALEFAARRLRDEPVAWLLARRVTGPAEPLPLERAIGDQRIGRVAVGPLSQSALYRLVRERLGAPLSRPALHRIHELSGGNPFFALELARAPAALQPGRELPPTLDVLIRRRLAALPAGTRRALAAAAAASQPTVDLAEAAAGATGALAAAEAAQLIVVERGQVRFTHPLLASGAYSLASPPQRRQTHARLAEAIADPEEHARHLALAASGPDPAVAAALDAAAVSAHARGAPTAAAQLLEDAAALTPPDRAQDARRRLLDAGLHHFESGDSRRALQILEPLAATLGPGPERAQALTRLARVRSYDDDLRAAAELCLQAVEEAGDDRHVRAQAHDGACSFLFRLRERLPEAVRHAQAAASLARELDDQPLLSDALAGQLVAEAMLGLESARATLSDLLWHQPHMESVRLLRQPKFSAGIVRIWWEEPHAASATYEELLARGREIGDESSVPYALVFHAQADLVLGKFARARRHADEGREHADQAGQEGMSSFLLAIRALTDAHLGAADAARAAAERALDVGARVNSIAARHFATAALGLLELSLGRPAEAVAHLGPLVEAVRAEHICEPGMNRFALDLVEALIELGRLDEAAELLDWYQGHAERLGRRGALANALRCRGLLAAAQGDDPLPLLERALAEHVASLAPFDRARTLLAHGAALRRAKRKRDARAVLEGALTEFERLGAALFAAGTRAEIARIGGRVAAADELTATERRVADLVAEGRTNREVAAALFLTTKTIEFHLRNVFRKLEIRSRAELVKRYR